jgi:hypothetical protein
MYTLNWIFSNGHAWAKEFSSLHEAEIYADTCGFFSNPCIERAWIESDNGALWLKEKHV